MEILNTASNTSEVRFTDRDRTWTGWIDGSAIDTTIDRSDRPLRPPPDWDQPRPFRIVRATSLRERPDGKLLIELSEGDEVDVIIDEPEEGYRLVKHWTVCDPDIAYVGYVRARDTRPPGVVSGQSCSSSSGGGEMTAWSTYAKPPRTEIEAGRFLLAPRRPTVVGCVRRKVSLSSLGDGVYAVPTMWGPVHVRLAPESLDGPCGTVESPPD
ncbi:MAG: hypothetical protein AAF799_35150 [Myxococcota bacterium]